MSGLSSWYQGAYANRYSPWSRTRSLQVAPTVARTDSRTARAAVQMTTAPEELGALEAAIEAPATAPGKEPETLFGPNIGVIPAAPAWTDVSAKAPTQADELTLDVLKGWIAKSKDGLQPTTTLQALVNLKRPTLRLSPLKLEEDEGAHAHIHALEFEYDCDAPQAALSVHVVLPSDHPEAVGKPATAGFVHSQVFSTTSEGGFGRQLRLDDQAVLELGRLEQHAKPKAPSVKAPTIEAPAVPEPAHLERPGAGRSRRFTLHLRRRTNTGLNQPQRAVAGPALAVLDDAADTKDTTAHDAETGVRVMIRLAARGENGAPLPHVNEQATYLHILRVGTAPTMDDEVDARPWVVKVVKREAVIGAHTFQLHEIYGLSAAPSAPAPTADTHTYPPSAPADDDAATECLLCLSAPREVVLLPCRHLVACRDCALNMIEFGAGGTIVNPEPEEPTAVEPAAQPAADGAGASAGQSEGEAIANGEAARAAAAVPTVQPTRRKRKAKGWFCPVCRQPYTSLLRITTVPPAKAEQSTAEVPAPASVPGTPNPAAGSPRPGFLRNWSLRSQPPAAPATEAQIAAV